MLKTNFDFSYSEYMINIIKSPNNEKGNGKVLMSLLISEFKKPRKIKLSRLI